MSGVFCFSTFDSIRLVKLNSQLLWKAVWFMRSYFVSGILLNVTDYWKFAFADCLYGLLNSS